MKSELTSIVHWSAALARLGACEDAVLWAMQQPDPEAAWRSCERGDWMLWLTAKLAGPPGDDSRRPLVLAACECARLVLHLLPVGEDRPRRAIEMAEHWAKGDMTLDDARVAAAADAANAAANANAYAANAYAAANAAAYAADAAAARRKTERQCADIVRRWYPTPPPLTATQEEKQS